MERKTGGFCNGIPMVIALSVQDDNNRSFLLYYYYCCKKDCKDRNIMDICNIFYIFVSLYLQYKNIHNLI